MRAQTLQRFVRCIAAFAGMILWLIAGIALAQSNSGSPQLKTVPEEAPKDPYHKSEKSEAPAQPPQKLPSPGEAPSVEVWRGEAQKLLDSLSKMLRSIPTYEAPTVDEKGDIIIRRRPPTGNDPKPAPPPQSDGKTLGT